MKMGRGYWLTTAACVLALAACKKSSTNTGTGTGGTGTAGTSTGTGGTSTGTGGTSTGTGGTSTAGSGASGKGSAGSTAGSGGAGGASGGAMAKATIATFGTGNTVTGTATLTQSGTDVTIKIDIMGCVAGKSYPVHIHTGTACTDATTQGGHWGAPAAGAGGAGGAGGTGGAGGASGAGGAGGASGAGGAAAAKIYRGEGIPAIMCGDNMMGTTTLTRKNTDPLLTWSIGGDMTTDVVGHVIVVHAPDMPTMPARIACGPITKS